MLKLISVLQKRLIIFIPITMVLGFLFGMKGDVLYLKKAIVPLTFLMVYPMMITLQLKKIVEGGDGKVQIAAQLINFLVVPVVAYGLGCIFFQDNVYLALGLLLTGLLPTSGMTISWTGMAKGNMAAAVKMTVFGLLLGSLLAPIYIQTLMGASISIKIISVFKQIAIIIVIPLILGNLTQRFLIHKFGQVRYQEEIKKRITPFSTIGVLGIVFVAMALKAKSIVNNPGALLWIFTPLLILYLVNIAVSGIVGKLCFDRGDGIALLYGTVMRNLSIALAIAMTAFGDEGADIALVVALGYIIQVQLAAWVVHFTDSIYGPVQEVEQAVKKKAI
ncbi:MAG: bile acid:sodium symporter [Spirochaetales bacterium]|nr:bile acid:sodium symporter [Spirochaetales bacterium]